MGGALSDAERGRLVHLRWFLGNIIMQERTLPVEGAELKAGNSPEKTLISNVRRTYVKRFVFVAHPIIEKAEKNTWKFKGIQENDTLAEHHQKTIEEALGKGFRKVFVAMSKETKPCVP